MIQCHSRRRRSGWTLLEMLLSLALTALVLLLVSQAIELFYKGLDRTRSDSERDQIARVVLRRISEDLRSAVQYQPPDLSGLQGAAGGSTAGAAQAAAALSGNAGAAAALSGAATGNSANSGSSSGTSSSSATSGSNSEAEDSAADESMTEIAPVNPGVFGGPDWLQIDICRLPRPDEIVSAVQSGRMTGAHESRMVTYSLNVGTDPSAGGLIRQEVSRAVVQYANQNGGEVDQPAQVLAPEITAIAFSYYDGVDWYDEWDSAALEALPLAIRIRVALTPPQTASTPATQTAGQQFTALSTDMAGDPDSEYELTVHLPAALTPDAPPPLTNGDSSSSSESGSESQSSSPSSPTGGSSADTPSSPTQGGGAPTPGQGGPGGGNGPGGGRGGNGSGGGNGPGGGRGGNSGGGFPGGGLPPGLPPGGIPGGFPGGGIPGGAIPGGGIPNGVLPPGFPGGGVQ